MNSTQHYVAEVLGFIFQTVHEFLAGAPPPPPPLTSAPPAKK